MKIKWHEKVINTLEDCAFFSTREVTLTLGSVICSSCRTRAYRKRTAANLNPNTDKECISDASVSEDSSTLEESVDAMRGKFFIVFT